MKDLTCAATRRRLQAFHDHELAVSDQIAVAAHLEWCDDCADALVTLRAIGGGLRASAGHATLTDEERERVTAAVVSRVRAERTASLFVRVHAMFEDMHFLYAGAGAAVAALFCVLSVTAMLRVAALAWPGSNQNPMPLSGRVLAPVALDEAFGTLVDPRGTNDSVFMIRAVVTREGTVENPELFHAMSGELPIAPGTEEARAAETLMGAVSRARFEPARVDGMPVAVDMVWMVANTTVRATATTGEKPLVRRPAAGSKRPAAWHAVSRARLSEV